MKKKAKPASKPKVKQESARAQKKAELKSKTIHTVNDAGVIKLDSSGMVTEGRFAGYYRGPHGYYRTSPQEREQQEIIWWLWKNVGHHRRKRKLSYGEIADTIKEPRSTVSTAVIRFDNKLKGSMDNKLLERLLLTAGYLHLGHNLTYNVLASRGLVPYRSREIDSFDQLDKLI